MRSLIPLMFLMALTTACSSPPEPAPPSPPRPVAQVAPPRPVAPPQTGPWEDRARSAGDWFYRQDARGSLGLFGMPGQDASFMIRCDRKAQRIYLSRQGAIAAGGSMTLRATTALQTYPASTNGDTPAYASVALGVREPQLDAMAFSRGKFLVQVSGMPDLVVPSWTEFGRVVEDCRGG